MRYLAAAVGSEVISSIKVSFFKPLSVRRDIYMVDVICEQIVECDLKVRVLTSGSDWKVDIRQDVQLDHLV
uniref:Uncharacterized protein n=1 Tax=Tetranychus urticae TaxID=32264 RepID=T1K511_TETUR